MRRRCMLNAARGGLALVLAGAGLKAQEPGTGARRPFLRPKVPVPQFTPAKTALVEPECRRIAVFLARYAAEKLTAGVLRGDAEAIVRGRLLLAVSLHLEPLNVSAVHCATRWSDGQSPALPPPGEDVTVFASFLLAAAGRQEAAPATPARTALARILVRLAADLDPSNEEAVYASELQDGKGKAPPVRELLEGTLGRDWPEVRSP